MATPIVFDGVGGGGTLFEGMKFFIVQRVPSRDTWINHIKANGGKVTKLDTQADIIIADHARKGNPPGSISWKYIEDSVKNGRLEDLDNYYAGPAPGAIRPVGAGASHPAKLGRTPFTAEDDRILVDWVTKAERSGSATKGNAIYQQLAEKYPHHTYQSWRDRYVKRVFNLSHPETPAEDASNRPSPEGQVPKRSQPIPRQAAAVQPPPLVQRVSAGGSTFSKEEIELLEEAYVDILDVDPKREIDAWQAWADQFPSHTGQEWHNCFVEYVLPKMKALGISKISSPSVDVEPLKGGIKTEDNAKLPLVKTKAIPDPAAQTAAILNRDGVTQIEREGARDPSIANEEDFNHHLSIFANNIKPEVELEFNPTILGRKISLFKIWQVVRSDTFHGYKNVEKQGLWWQVAKQLNFNEFRDTEAVSQLKAWYEEILGDFEDTWEQWQETDPSLTEEQMQELIEYQLRETANSESENADEEAVEDENVEVAEEEKAKGFMYREDMDVKEDEYKDGLNSPSSPPLISKKRVVLIDGMMEGSASITPSQIYNKRQRVSERKDKELEIPSTPEHGTNYAFSPSPILGEGRDKDEDEDEEDIASIGSDDEMNLKPIRRPNVKGSQLRSKETQQAREPATQDFHFPPPDDEDIESLETWNPTPSQKTKSALESDAAAARSLNEDSSQPQTDLQREEIVLRAFIDHYVALGYPENIVIEALGVTTMETGDAAVVMEALMKGDDIPRNIQGVWTTEDDEALEGSVNSDDFERVLAKHGARRVFTRQRFIAEREEARREVRSG